MVMARLKVTHVLGTITYERNVILNTRIFFSIDNA